MPSFGQIIRCGKRTYTSQAAFSLLKETGLDDPLKAVEMLTNKLLDDVQIKKIPVLLKMLASYQGVTEIEAREMRESGRLIPLKNGEFRIEVRSSDPVGRRNFSIGHEIGHLLIPSYHENPTVKSDILTGEFPKNEEEFFCDLAARNLLLPEKLFRKRCSEVVPSIVGLLETSDAFEASIEATAIRLDQLKCWDCIPVVWELGLKPSQQKSDGQFALLGFEELSKSVEEYRVKFPAGNFLFPASRHIAMDSDMVSACLSNGRFNGYCILPTSGRDLECRVDAVVVPYRDEHSVMRHRIISLVYI